MTMPRRAVIAGWMVLGGLAFGLCGSSARSDSGEDSRTVLKFLKDLRDGGLHDHALYYIKLLQADAGLPAKIKDVLDYEEGLTLIDEAVKSGDLVLREELLRDAGEKLERFVKAHPDLMQARDAQVHIGKLLLERGHAAMILSEDTADATKKAAKISEARAAFEQARQAYGKTIEPLKEQYKKFAGFMEKDDARVAERDAIYATLLDALLQQGVADYELAESFPAGSPERAEWLVKAYAQFDAIHKDHREQWGGLMARMWQGKCFEEQGKIGEAVAIYKELMGHTDPKLRQLQRNVGYFYIVALGRRKQYALAADEASRWLTFYNRREERDSLEGLGVQTEYAKNLDAQMKEISSNERPKATKLIVDASSQVVRRASPYKKEALALLRKYKPSAAVKAEELVRITYEDAINQAEEAIGSQDWEKAIVLLKAAVRKADPARNIDKANRARYTLAFCYYKTNRFYEADVLAEHLARRYPQGGLSDRATEIAMQSLADAYNTYTEVDRISDLDRIINLARYTADTWPEKDSGDQARMNLGHIYTEMGKYDEALKVYSAIKPRSKQWIPVQNRLGLVHWQKSRLLGSRGDAKGSQVEAQKAIDALTGALKARRDSGAGQTDPGVIGNVGDLATVLTEIGKPAEALALLDPVIKAQTVKTGPGFAMLMEAQLKTYLVTGAVEPAMASIKALEEAGGAAGRAQLYYRLGKLLEKELDDLRAKKKTSALAKLVQSYRAILNTVVESKTGQTFESLEWAGSSLLALDAYADAEKVFRRMLTEFTQNPQFLEQPSGKSRLAMVRIKLAAALRSQNKFDEANSLVDELLAQKPTYTESLVEKGLLLEAEAEAGHGTWAAAIKHWESLTKLMERSRPRPATYYDAWYHVAWGLWKQKNTVKARQALMGVMRLSPNVGGPEMKAKYQGLIARLK
jgi:tetratricopeptide (TPR) repeat protein